MGELEEVMISRGLLTGKRPSGKDVAVPIQPAVLSAARLTKAKDRKDFRFEIDRNGGVSAVRLDESGGDRAHDFFPNRPARICLGGQKYSAQTRDGCKLTVAIPPHGRDLFHASAILRRSHPRGMPASGIVVTARFTDLADQSEVRESARGTGKDLWSPAWDEGAGSVVGALTISRLFHGEPKGRSVLQQKLGLNLPEGASRYEAVTRLGVVWVSRIAVDAPYRDRGIGKELLRVLRTSIGATFPWYPRLIEVMQSVPSEKATPARLSETDRSFFSHAGYHRYEKATYTAPARMVGDDGLPADDLTALRTLYYWAEIDPSR
jgi:hypothetical protein